MKTELQIFATDKTKMKAGAMSTRTSFWIDLQIDNVTITIFCTNRKQQKVFLSQLAGGTE